MRGMIESKAKDGGFKPDHEARTRGGGGPSCFWLPLNSLRDFVMMGAIAKPWHRRLSVAMGLE